MPSRARIQLALNRLRQEGGEPTVNKKAVNESSLKRDSTEIVPSQNSRLEVVKKVQQAREGGRFVLTLPLFPLPDDILSEVVEKLNLIGSIAKGNSADNELINPDPDIIDGTCIEEDN